MNGSASSSDHLHRGLPRRVEVKSPALPSQNWLGSGVLGTGRLTLYQRWAVEARITRITAVLQDLGDHVRRLRQEDAEPAPGEPSVPSSRRRHV